MGVARKRRTSIAQKVKIDCAYCGTAPNEKRERLNSLSAKRAILLSPYFPPSSLAGVHRARHLAKHLPKTDWDPIVLCVDERDQEEALDDGLAALVPNNVEIVKARALPAKFTRLAGIGDIGLRAWKNLKRELFGLLEKQAIGAVLITGSPYYPMLLAPEIRKKFRVPVVLDFQDPWVSAWGASRPLLSKSGIAHRLAVTLEPRALRGADFVTSVSENQNAGMAARYPWLDASKMAAIPIGGDPEDFSVLRASPLSVEGLVEPGHIHLSYVGTFLPRSAPLVRVLLQSFARLRIHEPALAQNIRLNFIGTSNQPNDFTTFRVRPIAQAEGVADAVSEIPQRVPYMKALGVLAQSQGLLLIGSDEPHYTASKIYPALMSGRPFLSLFHRESSAHAILSAAGGGCALSFANPSELSALEDELIDGLKRLAAHPESFGNANPAAYTSYEAGNIAGHFAEIFERIRVNCQI
jgi:hypothetical protein